MRELKEAKERVHLLEDIIGHKELTIRSLQDKIQALQASGVGILSTAKYLKHNMLNPKCFWSPIWASHTYSILKLYIMNVDRDVYFLVDTWW